MCNIINQILIFNIATSFLGCLSSVILCQIDTMLASHEIKYGFKERYQFIKFDFYNKINLSIRTKNKENIHLKKVIRSKVCKH